MPYRRKLGVITVFLTACMLGAGCGDIEEMGPEKSERSDNALEATTEAREAEHYEAFLRQVEELPDGSFLIDGDIWVPDDAELQRVWRDFFASDHRMDPHLPELVQSETGLGVVTSPLISSGALGDRDLTYCLSNDFTAAQQTIVANCLAIAANTWRPWTGVRFRYVPDENALCTRQNNRVDFHVRPLTASEQADLPTRLADTFLPGRPRSMRRLRIRPSIIANDARFRGLLLHELGHMLGFVHEHAVRPDTGCFNPNASGTMVTPYDSSSIMHYDWCNGARGHALSRLDQLGAQCVYFGECEWRRMPGSAYDVAAGGGQVWIVGTNRRLYHRQPDNTWRQMSGSNGFRIAVSSTGTAWLVNLDYDIYRYNNSTGNWDHMPGKAYDIGAGGGQVWIVGTNQRMYRWDASGNHWEMKNAGYNGRRITVDHSGRPWIVNTSGQIYVENSNGWYLLPGRALDIDAGDDGSVWIIGTNEGIYEFQPSSGGVVSPEWLRHTGSAQRITVDDTGTPWVVNGLEAIYRNRWY